MVYLCKLNEKRQNLPLMDIKDRIKQVMEDRHMNQQAFAEFIEQAPGTLSSIYTGRTRPTLNILDSIKKKIPDISIEWLMYGNGDMYVSHSQETASPSSTPLENKAPSPGSPSEPMINFDSPTPLGHNPRISISSPHTFPGGAGYSHSETQRESQNFYEREPRKVTEIRVYYDDQTYETFVPAKK